MSKKHAQKIEQANTGFERWRLMMGLTQQQAADRLEKSRRTVQAYERPDKKGRIATPSYTDRVVMQMLIAGNSLPDAWPE